LERKSDFRYLRAVSNNIKIMYRSHNCGELRLSDLGRQVRLAGWVSKIRDKGGLVWIDLRDRYGITQIILNESTDEPSLLQTARSLGREFVICVSGTVLERQSKNDKIPTGEIEIAPEKIEILNPAILPPFTIEDETDGGDDLRMKFRYLDLRRNPVRQNLELRHRVSQIVRQYLDAQQFIEVETPVLIKSTPEGARDFVVPSRMNPGEFYALPQSPQTFKQLLMVAGFDRYFQIVKCFRDEDLRADRQPEFTQIDCEMSFVEQEDILQTFEGLIKEIFSKLLQVELPAFRRMPFSEAMEKYGSDKPDLRFGMEFQYLKDLTGGAGFSVFDQVENVIGLVAKGCAEYTRKQLDDLTDWVKRPQIGAGGLIYVRYGSHGEIKSSVDKFYSPEVLKKWLERAGAHPGDLLLVLCGSTEKTRKALGELRLEMGNRLGLREKGKFEVLWVVDFPLLEFNEEDGRYYAMHHPFTSPKPDDFALLNNQPAAVRANAYDLVINGVEIGGGSIRIFNKELQSRMFNLLGFSEEEARKQFGFLLDAFEFGAPPHGGIAFGFDRLCSMLGGVDSIRDFIAFPKNNSGRDVMIDSPATIDGKQLAELRISLRPES
jgi:aspartyl-tRNA synthetase